ncbi:lipoprotein [Burkholderia pseudomallei]|nr:lipoprotein [Burkholderia pseudomallei]
MPAPPPHQYAMEQDGTYGYEPALSEDDVRSGKATKPLVMMRYVGRRDGTYVLLLIDPDNENYATRVTCQAPCNFAKLQTMSGTMVLKTETIRVAPNSLIGAMLDDALSGQLRPYGQTVTMPRPTAVPSTAQPADQSAPQDSSPQSDLQRTSFDCSKVGSIPEYLICHDPELAASDRELANIYQQAKDAVPDKAAFAARTRRQWNFRQRNCRDKPCFVSWYAYQKETLTKIAQTGDVNAQ